MTTTLPRPNSDEAGGEARGAAAAGAAAGAAASLLEHPTVARVVEALAAHQALGTVRVLTEPAPTAAAAAAQLGCEVGAIANSLVFAATDHDGAVSPLLVMTSGAHRVDTVGLAGLLNLASLDRATPDLVRSATGQPIGGVAPVGHPTRVRTLVDTTLAGFDRVWAAGGHPRTLFPTTYDELLRITGGTASEVA